MKVAIVRGPNLTAWELQSFLPIASQIEMTFFSTSITPLWKKKTYPIPLQRCFWFDEWFAWGGPYALRLFNGISSRTFGRSFYMKGLEEMLKPFQVIHTLETYNTFTFQSLQAKRRSGAKLIVTVWETIPGRGETHPIRQQRKRQVIQEADAFHVVSERTRRMLIQEGAAAEKIFLQPMGIDTDRFSPNPNHSSFRSSWNAAPEDFVVLCVARLVPEKGVEDLLQAIVELHRKGFKNVRLVYAGRGPLRKTLQNIARTKGLLPYLHFCEINDYAEMPAIYQSANVLVLPSRPAKHWEEQFGYALVEAMSSGLPVIGASSGAIPEVIRGAGILVPPEKPDELANTLQCLIQDLGKRKYYGTEGRALACEMYKGSQTAQFFLDLYKHLLAS